MSQLLMDAGLYEVVPGVYQVRGADISNLTIVEGEQGIASTTNRAMSIK
jgi:linear primary-alkylsulfatase